MPEPRYTLIWPDGSILTADTFKALERKLRRGQWLLYPTRTAFRRACVRRARVWSGQKISRHGSSKQFLIALADAQMCMIVDSRATAKEGRR